MKQALGDCRTTGFNTAVKNVSFKSRQHGHESN